MFVCVRARAPSVRVRSAPLPSSRVSRPAVGVTLSAEPGNAAERTLGRFSAVYSIDGVAEGMLTQHGSSPSSALNI